MVIKRCHGYDILHKMEVSIRYFLNITFFSFMRKGFILFYPRELQLRNTVMLIGLYGIKAESVLQ